jgi:hypothetical protein
MIKLFLLISLFVIFTTVKAEVRPTPYTPCEAQPWLVFVENILSAEYLMVQTVAYYLQYANATLTGGISNTGYVTSSLQKTRGTAVIDIFTLFGNATLIGTLTQSSYVRLKRNIVPLHLSLNKLTQLNGYTYN